MQVPLPRLWTREEFERAGELGLFGVDERLELIEGCIFEQMSPQKSAHATSSQLVEEWARNAFAGGFVVRGQKPLALGERSEPEPDVAVVTGAARDYTGGHPQTALLVVEIADTTLRYDRTTKASLYARAGIPEYWIVNLVDRVLEVYRQPAQASEQPLGHAYRVLMVMGEAERLAPLGAPHFAVTVSDLLP